MEIIPPFQHKTIEPFFISKGGLYELQAPKPINKTCKRETNGNHGGLPPNLGLKEATPAPGETRHKQIHATHSQSMHNHNSMTNLTQHILIHPIPRLTQGFNQ